MFIKLWISAKIRQYLQLYSFSPNCCLGVPDSGVPCNLVTSNFSSDMFPDMEKTLSISSSRRTSPGGVPPLLLSFCKEEIQNGIENLKRSTLSWEKIETLHEVSKLFVIYVDRMIFGSISPPFLPAKQMCELDMDVQVYFNLTRHVILQFNKYLYFNFKSNFLCIQVSNLTTV